MPQKLIRGIIYDDPKTITNAAYSTANELKYVMENVDELYNVLKEQGHLKYQGHPTRDELFITGCMNAIRDQYKGTQNLIIPSNAIDEYLYNNLKNIDISEDIINAFIDIQTSEKASDNKFYIDAVDNNGTIINTLSFDNIDEAAHFVMNRYLDNEISFEETNNLLNSLKEMI